MRCPRRDISQTLQLCEIQIHLCYIIMQICTCISLTICQNDIRNFESCIIKLVVFVQIQ